MIVSTYHFGARLVAPTTEYTLQFTNSASTGTAHCLRLQDIYDMQYALGGEAIPDWRYWANQWGNYRVNGVKFQIRAQPAASAALAQFVGAYVTPISENDGEPGTTSEPVWRPATQAAWIGLKSDPNMLVKEKPIMGYSRNGAATTHINGYIHTNRFNKIKATNTGFSGGVGIPSANETDPFTASFTSNVHPLRSNYLVIYTRMGESVTEGAPVTASDIHFQITLKFYIKVWDRLSTFIGIAAQDDVADSALDSDIAVNRGAQDYADGDTPP